MSFRSLSLTIMAMAAVVFLAAGCIDNSVPGYRDTIPGTVDDPTGSAFGDWNDGASPDTFRAGGAGADSGQWTPVDPDNNLNMPVVYFGYDTDQLANSELAKLQRAASFLNNQRPELVLIIEGHCDQRGTEEYNRALGQRRAESIRDYLTGEGVDDSRIQTISYGEDRPALEGEGEAAWRQNRRGVLVPAML